MQYILNDFSVFFKKHQLAIAYFFILETMALLDAFIIADLFQIAYLIKLFVLFQSIIVPGLFVIDKIFKD